MTDEEIAEEFVDTLLTKDNLEVDEFLSVNLKGVKFTLKQAGTLLGIIKGVGICSYLAGLKAGKDMGEHCISETRCIMCDMEDKNE